MAILAKHVRDAANAPRVRISQLGADVGEREQLVHLPEMQGRRNPWAEVLYRDELHRRRVQLVELLALGALNTHDALNTLEMAPRPGRGRGRVRCRAGTQRCGAFYLGPRPGR